MNIIIANTQEFNPQIGGVERVSTTLAKELVERGHNVYFVAYYKSPFSKDYTPVVEQLLLPNGSIALCDENIEAFVQYTLDKKVEIILNQAGNILDFTQLCVAVKEKTHVKLISEIHINPDYRIKGYLDCTSSKLKSQSTFTMRCKRTIKRLYPYKLKQIKNTEKKFYHYVYNNSDKTVLLSDYFRPVFTGLTGITDESKLTAISNPLSFQVNNVELSKKKKQLLFVGRLDYGHKRPDRVLEIWNLLHSEFLDWELIMLGDGPAKEELLALSENLKLKRVKFVGFQDPNSYYRDASIIVMTSSIEGFGMVLIEAAQYGVIPVALDTFESLQDIIIDSVTGYRIQTPFKQNACRALRKVMSDSEIRSKMAKSALANTSRFAVDKIANQWLDLFYSII